MCIRDRCAGVGVRASARACAPAVLLVGVDNVAEVARRLRVAVVRLGRACQNRRRAEGAGRAQS
eukprot:1907416-Prymnesium_polylepis.1